MTKNHRRKLDARKRAARNGERYTRALRLTSRSAGTPADTAEVTVPGVSTAEEEQAHPVELLQRVQHIVEKRGWTSLPGDDEHFMEDGKAVNLHVQWGFKTLAPDLSWDFMRLVDIR